jgi:hypothetical protein
VIHGTATAAWIFNFLFTLLTTGTSKNKNKYQQLQGQVCGQ